MLAEPSSGARHGPNALAAYQYLLDSPEFMAAHRPDLIVSAGRPGLSRAAARPARPPGARPARGDRAGTWALGRPAADRHRRGAAVRLTARAGPPGLRRLAGGLATGGRRGPARGGRRARRRREPDRAAAGPRPGRRLPDGALLWAASSLPVRDLDRHLAPRADLRVLASRGASGIDGSTSAAIGRWRSAHGGPAFALLGDLAFLHDASGLVLGPGEPRPDLCLVVVNNDGGGIFSTLEQAAFPDSFERVFGTPHGAGLQHLAAAVGLPYSAWNSPRDLTNALQGTGLRIVEAQTDRAAGAALRARLREAAAEAIRSR